MFPQISKLDITLNLIFLPQNTALLHCFNAHTQYTLLKCSNFLDDKKLLVGCSKGLSNVGNCRRGRKLQRHLHRFQQCSAWVQIAIFFSFQFWLFRISLNIFVISNIFVRLPRLDCELGMMSALILFSIVYGKKRTKIFSCQWYLVCKQKSFPMLRLSNEDDISTNVCWFCQNRPNILKEIALLCPWIYTHPYL